MTNFEYVMKHLTERDLAYFIFPHSEPYQTRQGSFSGKIYYAFNRWAESASSNHGNMAKGCVSGDHVIEENPSIWAWERWYFPDGTWRSAGRTRIVAFQVWLSEQYNPEDWSED